MAKLLPPVSSAKVSKPTMGDMSSPLAGRFLNTKKKVITIEKLFKDKAENKKESEKQKTKLKERERRDAKETKLEKKPSQTEAKKKSTKIPGSSFLEKIKNFIGKIVLGYFVTRLVELKENPQVKSFLEGAAAAGDFIIDWGGKIFNGLVTFLDKSYEMYDGLKTKVDDLFGQEGVTQLENFAASFKKVANYTLITAMAFGGFGERAAEAQKALAKRSKGIVKGVTTRTARSLVGLFGKRGARLIIPAIKLLRPVIKRIPFIGPLVNFLISYFIFKEPIGKAALRTVGSAIFGALGATIGTIGGAGVLSPLLGPAGAFLGSVAGDFAGGWLYDTFFSGKKPIEGDKTQDQRPPPSQTSTQPAPAGAPVAGNLQGTKEEKWAAIVAMAKKAGAKYPELVAAQFALESAWGTALSAPNNFFGIKATESEAATTSATQEVYGGVTVNTAGRFKNFASPQDAVNHLVTQWYKDYRGYTGVNRASSAEEAAELLKRYSYATDPRYPGKLKRLLRQYKNVTVVRPAVPSSGSSGSTGSTGSTRRPSGTPGPRSRGTKISGDLGRWLYKELSSPRDFQAVTEHPDFGGSFRRSYNSYHNYDRAIDIGAYPHEQPKILEAIKKFNRINGVSPVELIHAGNDPVDHGDHVHIAYRRGGVVPKDLYALLHKGEIVIDPDSAGPAKQMLLAINEANSYEGIVKAIRQYAPYDALSQQTILMPQQSGGSQQMYSQGEGGVAYLPVSGAVESSSPTDILYKGA